MQVIVTINGDVKEFDSLLTALRSLAEAHGYRWGLPSSRALERKEVPSDLSMPALYDNEGFLVTTHPSTALRKLVEHEASSRLDGSEVSIANGDVPEALADHGFVSSRRVQWLNASGAGLMGFTDVLRWREAEVQIADFRAAQARRERDLDLDSIVGGGSLTAYRAAKTLKMSPTAVGLIRKRLADAKVQN